MERYNKKTQVLYIILAELSLKILSFIIKSRLYKKLFNKKESIIRDPASKKKTLIVNWDIKRTICHCFKITEEQIIMNIIENKKNNILKQIRKKENTCPCNKNKILKRSCQKDIREIENNLKSKFIY